MIAIPLGEWNRDQCLDWLENEGVINCAMAGDLLDDELQIEIALQAEAMEVEIPGMQALLEDYWSWDHSFTTRVNA